jgi:homospermidine synthase
METVIAIKLISGEDIIGKLVSNRTDNEIITLDDARVIAPTQNGIGLMPVMMANPEAQISINRCAIAVN